MKSVNIKVEFNKFRIKEINEQRAGFSNAAGVSGLCQKTLVPLYIICSKG